MMVLVEVESKEGVLVLCLFGKIILEVITCFSFLFYLKLNMV